MARTIDGMLWTLKLMGGLLVGLYGAKPFPANQVYAPPRKRGGIVDLCVMLWWVAAGLGASALLLAALIRLL